MPHKDVVSWTGMLSTFVRYKCNEAALELYNLMKISGQCPNEFTLSSVVRSCFVLGEFDQGLCVHADAIKHGLASNPVLGSSLIDFYSKNDHVDESFKLFNSIQIGDTVSWTTMISSFLQAHKWNQALQLYPLMLESQISPNAYTFVKLLSACSSLGIQYGKLIHAHVIIFGEDLNIVLKTALVDMYSKCKEMDYALKLKEQTPEQDVQMWTTLITGFNRSSKFYDAIAAFCEMIISGLTPNNYTYSGILNACSSMMELALSRQIHGRVIIVGLERDVSVGNALVNVYMKCSNMINDALKAFRCITSPNIISWTSLISGLAENGHEHESLRAFQEMYSVGEQPNSFTISSILNTCGSIRSFRQTRKLHGYVIKTKEASNIIVANSLVDAYAGSGMFDDAWHVIQGMSHRDAITYTSLATRTNQMGYHEMALSIISAMFEDHVKMDDFSLSSFLSASAGLNVVEPGKQLHCYAVKSGLGNCISVLNGLVDLYGKCGFVQDAKRAFEEISTPNVISWNGLMFGLASNGSASSALATFDEMRLVGVRPDSVTLLLLLYACSHGGLADLGLEYFHSMRERYDIVPEVDHYICLVDLLGRVGRLEEAVGVIDTMSFRPDALVYKTLLSSCKLHGNIPLGEDMAMRGLNLDPFDPAFYILLANMYDDFGRPELGEKTRKLMRERGLRKTLGQSWVELRSKVHLFTARDKTHPRINEIHKKIESLINEFRIKGYSYQNDANSSYHSEKLAVVFSLVSQPSSAPLRVMKNLRTCYDCHEFMANLSRLLSRKIIVRDGNRFHSFKNGECSCKGFW